MRHGQLYLQLKFSKTDLSCAFYFTFEPLHEKTNNLGFRPGLTQTGLYNHKSRLEA